MAAVSLLKQTFVFICVFLVAASFCVVLLIDFNHIYHNIERASRFSEYATYAVQYIRTVTNSRTPLTEGVLDGINRELKHTEAVIREEHQSHVWVYFLGYETIFYEISNDFTAVASTIIKLLQAESARSTMGRESLETSQSQAILSTVYDDLQFSAHDLSVLVERMGEFVSMSERQLYVHGGIGVVIMFFLFLTVFALFWMIWVNLTRQFSQCSQLAQRRLPILDISTKRFPNGFTSIFQDLCGLLQVQDEKLTHINDTLSTSFGKYGKSIISASLQGDTRVQYIEHYSTDLSLFFEQFNEHSTEIFTALHVLQDFSHSMQELNNTLNQGNTFVHSLNGFLVDLVPSYTRNGTAMTENITALKSSVTTRQNTYKNLVMYSDGIKKNIVSITDKLKRINNLADMLLVLTVNANVEHSQASDKIRNDEIEQICHTLRELTDLLYKKNLSDNDGIENICATIDELETTSDEEKQLIQSIEDKNKEQYDSLSTLSNLKGGVKAHQSNMATIKNVIEHGRTRIDENIAQIRLKEIELKSTASEIRRIISFVQEGSVQLMQNLVRINADFHNLQYNSEFSLEDSTLKNGAYDNMY